MVPEVWESSYRERKAVMELSTLEEGTKRRNKTTMNKFRNRHDVVDIEQFFVTGNARIVRGHSRNLSKKQAT